MKHIITILFAIVVFSLCTTFAQTPRTFTVTQSMNYKGGVDLAQFGVPRNPIIYESALLPAKHKDDLLAEPQLQAFAAKLQPGPLPTVIDIERWSIYTKDNIKRTENLQKLLLVMNSLRKARPDIHFGYYGVVPERVYWPLVDSKQQNAKLEWEAFNRMAQNDFVPYVDAIFPSLYTFYEDQKGWEIYAKETLKAARRFKKPVYAYLWPQYHDSNQKLKGQYLPPEYWRLQLETCLKYCDGIVIWNHEPEKAWDPEAPWWKETVAFLEKLKKR